MYRKKVSEFGVETTHFLEKVKKEKTQTWIQIIRGILSLKKNYDTKTINLACKRALEYQVYEYSTVKNICKNGLYDKKKEKLAVNNVTGYSFQLKKYDDLFNNNLNKNQPDNIQYFKDKYRRKDVKFCNYSGK